MKSQSGLGVSPEFKQTHGQDARATFNSGLGVSPENKQTHGQDARATFNSGLGVSPEDKPTHGQDARATFNSGLGVSPENKPTHGQDARATTRRRFLRQAGWAFTGLLFVPKLIRAQSILTAPGLASFQKKTSGGGGGGGDTPFISSVSGGTSRNNFTGIVGFKFTVGGTGITVTSLGRYVLGTSANAHTVYILTATGGILASASVPTSGIASGTFSWASISSLSLVASTSYYCVSKETNGDGDHWLSDDCTIATTAVGTVTQSCFSTSNPPTTPSISASGVKSFVPPNFRYH